MTEFFQSRINKKFVGNMSYLALFRPK